ncbi:hypothetical protein GQ607_000265, partial [Colletotrichum asianum]
FSKLRLHGSQRIRARLSQAQRCRRNISTGRNCPLPPSRVQFLSFPDLPPNLSTRRHPSPATLAARGTRGTVLASRTKKKAHAVRRPLAQGIQLDQEPTRVRPSFSLSTAAA